ncbi:MAG: 50S ribosomal protein L25 [Candidatus Neomarinimicrobiota bacterium]|nr:50S ribosomal protein L25 [Candidatus Neomarinimicrobiota bacterium]RKY50082.1 MAG: 50S ribosomal protein L25 [Candidatus Neomarinimicrobiota bacterium]
MKEFNLEAKRRTKLTHGETNRLRREGKVPGVYYFHREDPIPVYVEKKDLIKLIHLKAHIINLNIGRKKYKVIIRGLQHHPVTDDIIHVDFMGVTEKEIIEVEVPVHIKGEARGVKEFGGILEQHLWSLDVKCEADRIPDSIDIDVSELNVGDTVYVSDLKLEGIKILNPLSAAIVSVVRPAGVSEEAIKEGEVEEAEVEEETPEGKKEKPE